MNPITVIIPFRNEGREVWRTITELNRCCDVFTVIAINDASDDNYDYPELKEIGNVIYLENTVSIGVAACRDLGAQAAETPFLLFLDGHMHIEDDIISPLIAFLRSEPESLACLQTRVWEGCPPTKRKGIPQTRGCRINFSPDKMWVAEWLMLRQEDTGRTEIEIPCVMGAAYGIARACYLRLHGLVGLSGWGCDEQFLSAKVWLSGGRCLLLRNIEIGHNYRNSFPYHLPDNIVLRNKVLITKLLCPESEEIFINGQLAQGNRAVLSVTAEMEKEKEKIEQEREYLKSIFRQKWIFWVKQNRCED